jgi:thermitase
VNSKFRYLTLLRSLVVAAIVIAAATVLPASAQAPPPQSSPAGDFAPGRILVKFKPGVSQSGAQRALSAQNLNAASAADAIPALGVLKVPVTSGQELAEVAALRGDPNVLYAEPDYIAHAQPTTPNDPYYGSQWGLSKINAPAAWDMATGSSAVVIAIVDTGIDLSHPDLSCAGKLTAARWNFVSGNNYPQDDNGHGTHVAGIAAACGNNGIGVAGVAWGVRLMPIKALDANGSGYYSNIAAGITYAVDNGARVVSLSLAGASSSTILANAVQYAHDHGVLVVAAAGNCAQGGSQCGNLSNPVMYPAAYPTALAVAATDSGDNWASFSEHQPYVGVAAPGVNIYSTLRGGGYGTMTGTSMATPYVSGLAALLWSFAPSFTVDQIKSIIESTADDLGAPGKDDYFGYGRINAGRTLSSLSLLASSTQASFLFSDDGGATSARSVVQVTTANPNPINWTATVSPPAAWLSIAPPASGMVSASSSPAQFTLVATRPAAPGTYAATVVVAGTTSTGGPIRPVTIAVHLSYFKNLYRNYLPDIRRN